MSVPYVVLIPRKELEVLVQFAQLAIAMNYITVINTGTPPIPVPPEIKKWSEYFKLPHFSEPK